MNAFRITFADGNYIQTNMNATLDEAIKYYVGHTFNLGRGEDDYCVKAVSVKQI